MTPLLRKVYSIDIHQNIKKVHNVPLLFFGPIGIAAPKVSDGMDKITFFSRYRNVFIYPSVHQPCEGNKHLYIIQGNVSQIGLYKIRISLIYTGRLITTPNGKRLFYKGGYYRIFASALIFSNYIS